MNYCCYCLKMVDQVTFEAKITDSTHFKNVIHAIRELMDDVTFECTEEGMYVQGMDTSHISLIDFNLNTDYFHSYTIQNGPINLNVNLKLLGMILKCVEPTDQTILEYDNKNDKLTIKLRNDRRTNEFQIPLLDMENDKMGIPEVEHDYVLNISPKELNKYVSNISTMGVTDVTFMLENDKAFIKAISDEINLKMELVSGNEDVMEQQNIHLVSNTEEELNMTFSFVYISKFMKAANLTKKIKIYFTEDMPLRVEFGFNNGKLNYFLAPKIEDD